MPTFEEIFPPSLLGRRTPRKPFATARHIFGLIAAAMSITNPAYRVAAMRMIPPYWSRGKGKAHKKPYQRTVLAREAKPSKYTPHRGQREQARRFRQELRKFTKDFNGTTGSAA